MDGRAPRKVGQNQFGEAPPCLVQRVYKELKDEKDLIGQIKDGRPGNYSTVTLFAKFLG